MFKTMFLIVVLVCFPLTTLAQQICGNRNDFVTSLKSKYGELTVATGITSEYMVVEILATENGSTWTAFSTRTNGVSCLFAVGKNLITGNLGKITDILPNEGYPNLVAVGKTKDGRHLTVITNSDLQWKILLIGSSESEIFLVFKGDDWAMMMPSNKTDQEI